MAEYIEREKVTELIDYYTVDYFEAEAYFGLLKEDFMQLPSADVLPIPDGGIGEVSDGYHTFNGLYYQRMVLFAALVKQNKDKAWKSLRHEDGELCFGGGWFIVGIDTPSGSYTYHYEDNFWSMFDCQELPVAKHWDGHTEKDVTRLLSLADVQPVTWIPVTERLPETRTRCVTISRDGDYGLGIYTTDYGWMFPYYMGETTHWMPLPEPPKDGEA